MRDPSAYETEYVHWLLEQPEQRMLAGWLLHETGVVDDEERVS